jgi:hypothetical protein
MHLHMHIIYVSTHIEDLAGGVRVIIEHINRLQARGHNVELWSTQENPTIPFPCVIPVSPIDADRLNEPDILD